MPRDDSRRFRLVCTTSHTPDGKRYETQLPTLAECEARFRRYCDGIPLLPAPWFKGEVYDRGSDRPDYVLTLGTGKAGVHWKRG